MIKTPEQAAVVFSKLNTDETFSPEDFWRKAGWDFEMIKYIAKLGADLHGLDVDDVCVAMQMGAALALGQVERDKDEEEIVI